MTNTTHLPKDNSNYPIQALSFKPGKAQVVAIASASAKNAVAMDPCVVATFIPTVACYFKQGDNTVVATATDNYWPAGLPCTLAMNDREDMKYTHIAFLRVGGSDGIAYISERE